MEHWRKYLAEGTAADAVDFAAGQRFAVGMSGQWPSAGGGGSWAKSMSNIGSVHRDEDDIEAEEEDLEATEEEDPEAEEEEASDENETSVDLDEPDAPVLPTLPRGLVQ